MTALDDICATPFHDADAPARARILSRLADTELSVALAAEPQGDDIRLRLFDLPEGRVALACDGEDRLAGFMGETTDFVAMPGRVLAGLLQDDGVGLLVNPGHPSQMLLDAETLGWLAQALSVAPEPGEARLRLGPPTAAAVATLAEPLAQRLADMRALIAGAALAGTQAGGHVLLIAGAAPESQPAIAKALAEALAFLPEIAGGVDVSFSEVAPPAAALCFDLTPPAREKPDRKGPPILR